MGTQQVLEVHIKSNHFTHIYAAQGKNTKNS